MSMRVYRGRCLYMLALSASALHLTDRRKICGCIVAVATIKPGSVFAATGYFLVLLSPPKYKIFRAVCNTTKPKLKYLCPSLLRTKGF
jgi:hypothetical protein